MYVGKKTFPGQKQSSQSGYVLHLTSSDSHLIAAGKSTVNYLNVIDKSSFQLVTTLGGKEAHTDTICDVDALGNSTYLSCGRDGFVKIWDSRQPLREVWSSKVSHAQKDAEVNAVAASGDLLAVSSGTHVKVFDMRTKALYHEYTELHSEPITGMQFQSRNILVTSSEDGMIAVADVYDLKNEDEGQAPIVAMNTQGGLRGLRVLDDTIFGISATESLSVWRLDGTPLLNVGSGDTIRTHPLLAVEGSLGYIIDIFNIPGVGYAALAGSSRGDMILADLSKEDVPLIATFRSDGGHTEVIRDSARDDQGRLFTGGEDGKIIQWSLEEPSITSADGLGPAEATRRNRAGPY